MGSYRFLFCPWPSIGETLPLLAVADALRQQGHSCVFIAPGHFAPWMAHRGHTTLPGVRRWRALSPHRSAVEAYLLDPLLEEVGLLLDAIRTLRPHVLVDGVLPFGPRLVAELTGLPRVSIAGFAGAAPPHEQLHPELEASYNRLISASIQRDGELNRWNELRRSLGLPPDVRHPWFASPSEPFIVPTTEEFEGRPPPPGTTFVGALPSSPPDVVSEIPGWLVEPDDRPTIFATQGTIHHDRLSILRLAAESLADEPVRLVMTLNRTFAPGEIPRHSDAQRVFPLLPVDRVFPLVDAVVSHGGPGTVAEALRAGRPLLVLPLGADQPYIADRVVAVGAGLQLDPRTATAEQFRTALHRLLDDHDFYLAAEKQRAAFAASGGPGEAARLLVGVAASNH